MDLSNMTSNSEVIPKIIHFVWVGAAPKPDLVTRCMASWVKFCPEYEIIEWGNSQLSKINNAYAQEAAEAGKWAFVSDYMRLYALYKHGGFYFDSDLELTAPIESFRKYDFLSGFEKTLDGKRVRPITALMASAPQNPIIGSLLSEYENIHFNQNGVTDLTTNTDRITRHFRKKYALKKSQFNRGRSTLFLEENSVIFPYYFFCTPERGFENYAIHHFNGSWVPPGKRKVLTTIRNWRILKFTLKDQESAKSHITNDEKFFVQIPLPGKKKRALVLVRRKKT